MAELEALRYEVDLASDYLELVQMEAPVSQDAVVEAGAYLHMVTLDLEAFQASVGLKPRTIH